MKLNLLTVLHSAIYDVIDMRSIVKCPGNNMVNLGLFNGKAYLALKGSLFPTSYQPYSIMCYSKKEVRGIMKNISRNIIL